MTRFLLGTLTGLIIGLVISFIVIRNMNNNFLILKKQISTDSLLTLKEPLKNLNFGGCGYFALHLYQKLDKNKYRIISVNNFNHVCLQDKETGAYIDSNGYHSLFELQCLYGFPTFKVIEMDESHLIDAVQNPKYWNTRFKRADTVVINRALNYF